MYSCNLAASITFIACAISEGKTQEELAILASVFNQLGDTLATISASNTLSNTTNN